MDFVKVFTIAAPVAFVLWVAIIIVKQYRMQRKAVGTQDDAMDLMRQTAAVQKESVDLQKETNRLLAEISKKLK